jgi:hypothetical protein
MIEQGAEKRQRTEERERLLSEFKGTTPASLSKMSDIDLACWQSQYPKESPQSLFAEQFWKYRLARRSAAFTAVIAIISALTGAVTGYLLRGLEGVAQDCSEQKPKQAEPPQMTPEVGKLPKGRFPVFEKPKPPGG